MPAIIIVTKFLKRAAQRRRDLFSSLASEGSVNIEVRQDIWLKGMEKQWLTSQKPGSRKAQDRDSQGPQRQSHRAAFSCQAPLDQSTDEAGPHCPVTSQGLMITGKHRGTPEREPLGNASCANHDSTCFADSSLLFYQKSKEKRSLH